MADSASPAAAVLDALGFVLFLRDDDGALRLHGSPPAWLRALWTGLTKAHDALPLAAASPFLENFLIDAAQCWAAGGERRVQSGPWVEQAGDGREVSLEATALTIEGRAALLLERLGEMFEAKKSMLQTARETVIAYQRLNSETQKKEILLSCIAEEMNAALANAITALRLIECEKHSPRTQQLLTLAMRATGDQQALINKVMNVFAAELAGLYGRDGGGAAEASLGEVFRSAAEAVAPSFAGKRVTLQLPRESAGQKRVAMGADHLSRALTGLLENALENAPAASTVSLEVAEEPDAVVLRVIDHGPPLPAAVCEDFFSRAVIATEAASPSQLRLQFCRMAVEKCHGETGCQSQENGANCFFIRLPKPAAAAAA